MNRSGEPKGNQLKYSMFNDDWEAGKDGSLTSLWLKTNQCRWSSSVRAFGTGPLAQTSRSWKLKLAEKMSLPSSHSDCSIHRA